MGKPKSLAMRKMEKNFIAYLEKKYPRKPYSKFPVWFLIERLRQEVEELNDAVLKYKLEIAMNECADISNIIDFIFERLMIVRGRGLNVASKKKEET